MRVLLTALSAVVLTTAAVAQDPTPVGLEFEIATTVGSDGWWPRVASGMSGDFVVVWDNGFQTVRGQRFSANGSTQGSNFVVNSNAVAYQVFSSVDIGPNGDFVVVWQGGRSFSTGQDGALGGILLQRFDATGAKVGDEFVVNSYTTGNQGYAAVSVGPSGDFVVVWGSDGSLGPDTGVSVQAQRFLASGVPVGGEFQVNSYTTGYQTFPAIDHAPNGDFVVVWGNRNGSPGDDNIEGAVVARRFLANGSPAAPDFQVNTFTLGTQGAAEVAVGPSGDFMVVWSNSFASVEGQRFKSDGSPDGPQFQVPTYTTSPFLQYPTVAASSDGEFLVTWSSGHHTEPGPDGNRRAVAAQLYAAQGGGAVDGGRVGNEIVVNTFTISSQWRSAVSSGPGGMFRVVWQNDGAADNRGQLLRSPNAIYSDGFESGDTVSWSVVAPRSEFEQSTPLVLRGVSAGGWSRPR